MNPLEGPPDRSGVVVPPPLFYLAGLLVGFPTQWAYPAAILPEVELRGIGLGLILASIVIASLAIATMKRAETSHNVFEPTTTIVTRGPYRFSRNPMYLSLTMLYLGIAVTANALWVLLLVVPILAAMHRLVIVREERYLERKFGDTYLRYRSRVRRWI